MLKTVIIVVAVFLFFPGYTLPYDISNSEFQSHLLVPEPVLDHFLNNKDYSSFLTFFLRADSLVINGKPVSGLHIYRSALATLRQPNSIWLKIILYNRLGFTNDLINNQNQSDKYYKEAYKLIVTAHRIEDTLAVYETASFLSSKDLLRKTSSRKIMNCIPSVSKLSAIRKAKYYYVKSWSYNPKIDYQYNQDMLNLEESLTTSTYPNWKFWAFFTRYKIAEYSRLCWQFTIAEKYFSNLLAKMNNDSTFNCYRDKIILEYADDLSYENPEKTKQLLSKIEPHLSLLSVNEQLDYNLTLANLYLWTFNGKMFDHYVSEAESLVRRNHVKGINLYWVLSQRGEYYLRFSHEYVKGITVLRKAKKVLATIPHVEKNDEYINVLLGACLCKNKEYSQSMDLLEKYLKGFLAHAYDTVYMKQEANKISYQYRILELNDLANDYYFLAKNQNYNLALLKKSYQLQHLCLAFDKVCFKSAISDKMRFTDIKNLILNYQNLINIGYELMIRNGDSTMINDFFSYSENCKFITLKSNLTDDLARKAAGIPQQVSQKMTQMGNELDELKIDLESNPNQRIGKIHLPIDLYMQKKRKYDSLLQAVEIKYPEYLKYKNTENPVTLKEIQQHLNNDQALIEYFSIFNAFYTFYVDKKHIKFLLTPLDSSISGKIHHYHQLLSSANFNNNSLRSIKEFVHESSWLYNLMIKPIEGLIKNKRLFIVRDKALNLIPFETLISSSPSDSINYRKGYSNLPFLNNTNPISYGYSASQLIDKPGHYKNVKFAAFVPSYDLKNNLQRSDDSLNTILNVLKGAANEVATMKNYYPGKIYRNKKVTKRNFFDACNKYNIVHLAMHAKENFNTPLNSELIFNPNYKKKQDQLRAFEIYTHKINADLIVLSACNTQNGKIITGEGIMGLTWAFLLAGTKNLLTTQWSVADRSGAFIMDHFYSYLSKGYSDDVALQKAKIDFLKLGDPVKSNPFYWASYVCIGNPATYSPADKYRSIKIFSALFLLVIAGIVLFWIRQKRLRSLKNNSRINKI